MLSAKKRGERESSAGVNSYFKCFSCCEVRTVIEETELDQRALVILSCNSPLSGLSLFTVWIGIFLLGVCIMLILVFTVLNFRCQVKVCSAVANSGG